MMEFLSDSTVNSFSSETLSPDLSSDISNKSSIETVTSSPDSRLKESLSSTSTVHSKHKKISRRTSRSSESETVCQLTSTDGSSFQESSSPEDGFLRICHQVLKNQRLHNPSEAKDGPSLSTMNSSQMEFCEKCITILNSTAKLGNKLDTVADHSSRTETVRPEMKGHPISNGIIERLKMENLIHSMREVTKIPDTISLQDCQVCRRMQKDNLERSLIQDKVRHLKNKLTEEKYQKYITEMDPVSQVGAIAAGLPKATDPPEEIWNKLLER